MLGVSSIAQPCQLLGGYQTAGNRQKTVDASRQIAHLVECMGSVHKRWEEV